MCKDTNFGHINAWHYGSVHKGSLFCKKLLILILDKYLGAKATVAMMSYQIAAIRRTAEKSQCNPRLQASISTRFYDIFYQIWSWYMNFDILKEIFKKKDTFKDKNLFTIMYRRKTPKYFAQCLIYVFEELKYLFTKLSAEDACVGKSIYETLQIILWGYADKDCIPIKIPLKREKLRKPSKATENQPYDPLQRESGNKSSTKRRIPSVYPPFNPETNFTINKKKNKKKNKNKKNPNKNKNRNTNNNVNIDSNNNTNIDANDNTNIDANNNTNIDANNDSDNSADDDFDFVWHRDCFYDHEEKEEAKKQQEASSQDQSSQHTTSSTSQQPVVKTKKQHYIEQCIKIRRKLYSPKNQMPKQVQHALNWLIPYIKQQLFIKFIYNTKTHQRMCYYFNKGYHLVSHIWTYLKKTHFCLPTNERDLNKNKFYTDYFSYLECFYLYFCIYVHQYMFLQIIYKILNVNNLNEDLHKTLLDVNYN